MSSPLPGLQVESVTGIDVSLPVAGAGARSFAFLIDWHIRLLLALGWYVAAALIYNGRLSLAPSTSEDARWFAGVLAPALAIYLLYHWVLELAMRGSTPGKRTAGVRIVARDGSAASAGALLARNAFRIIDSLPAFYCVGLVTAIVTREHVRIGDMAAGTLLVYEHAEARLPAAAQAAAPPQLDPAAAELVAELLERWPSLTVESRQRLAQQLLGRYAAHDADGGEASLHERLERLLRPLPGGAR